MTAVSTLPYGRAETRVGGTLLSESLDPSRTSWFMFFNQSQRAQRVSRTETEETNSRQWGGHYCCFQVISTFTGISFLIGIVSSVGGSILKSVSFDGMVPVIFFSFPCDAT